MWRERFLIVQIYYARLKPEGCFRVISQICIFVFFTSIYGRSFYGLASCLSLTYLNLRFIIAGGDSLFTHLIFKNIPRLARKNKGGVLVE